MKRASLLFLTLRALILAPARTKLCISFRIVSNKSRLKRGPPALTKTRAPRATLPPVVFDPRHPTNSQRTQNNLAPTLQPAVPLLTALLIHNNQLRVLPPKGTGRPRGKTGGVKQPARINARIARFPMPRAPLLVRILRALFLFPFLLGTAPSTSFRFINKPPRLTKFAPLLLAALLFSPHLAHAQQNAPVGGGGSCTYSLEPDGSVGQQQAYNNGLYTCLSGGTWTPEALYIGDTLASGSAATCTSSSQAGLLEWTGSALEFCNGSSFTTFSTGSLDNVDIQLASGTAAAPSLSFYADTTSGLWQSAAGALDFSTDAAEVGAFDSTGDFNLTNAGATSTGKYEINGTTVLALPDKDTTSIAVGSSALAAQNATGSDNTAVGDLALDTITSGTESTAIGYQALKKATGSPNDALGYNAGEYVSSGSSNVAIGFEAMQGVSATPLTGTDNTVVGNSALLVVQSVATANAAFGDDAGEYISTGNYNTALGFGAMQGVAATPLTGNGYNVAVGASALNVIQGAPQYDVGVGENALVKLTTGNNNTAVGAYAGYYITTGTFNVAVGSDAISGSAGSGPALTTGQDNVAVGDSALFQAQGDASYNTAIGDRALQAVTTGTENTAVGALALGISTLTTGPNSALGVEAGQFVSSGTHNTAIGYTAMQGVSATPLTTNSNTAVGDTALNAIEATAAQNTALGYQAGYAVTPLTTGSNNVYIGYNTSAKTPTDTNEIVIGASATGMGTNSAVIGNTSITDVYLGGNSSCVNGSACSAGSTTSTAGAASGAVGHAHAWNSWSDRRLKKDIQDSDLGLDFIEKLRNGLLPLQGRESSHELRLRRAGRCGSARQNRHQHGDAG
jgi:hypothetical protein